MSPRVIVPHFGLVFLLLLQAVAGAWIKAPRLRPLPDAPPLPADSQSGPSFQDPPSRQDEDALTPTTTPNAQQAVFGAAYAIVLGFCLLLIIAILSFIIVWHKNQPPAGRHRRRQAPSGQRSTRDVNTGSKSLQTIEGTGSRSSSSMTTPTSPNGREGVSSRNSNCSSTSNLSS